MISETQRKRKKREEISQRMHSTLCTSIYSVLLFYYVTFNPVIKWQVLHDMTPNQSTSPKSRDAQMLVVVECAGYMKASLLLMVSLLSESILDLIKPFFF